MNVHSREYIFQPFLHEIKRKRRIALQKDAERYVADPALLSWRAQATCYGHRTPDLAMPIAHVLRHVEFELAKMRAMGKRARETGSLHYSYDSNRHIALNDLRILCRFVRRYAEAA